LCGSSRESRARMNERLVTLDRRRGGDRRANALRRGATTRATPWWPSNPARAVSCRPRPPRSGCGARSHGERASRAPCGAVDDEQAARLAASGETPPQPGGGRQRAPRLPQEVRTAQRHLAFFGGLWSRSGPVAGAATRRARGARTPDGPGACRAAERRVVAERAILAGCTVVAGSAVVARAAVLVCARSLERCLTGLFTLERAMLWRVPLRARTRVRSERRRAVERARVARTVEGARCRPERPIAGSRVTPSASPRAQSGRGRSSLRGALPRGEPAATPGPTGEARPHGRPARHRSPGHGRAGPLAVAARVPAIRVGSAPRRGVTFKATLRPRTTVPSCSPRRRQRAAVHRGAGRRGVRSLRAWVAGTGAARI